MIIGTIVFTKVTVVILPVDLVHLQSIGVLSLPRPISMWNMKPVINCSQDNERKPCLYCFYKSGHCDLYLWPSKPKLIGILSSLRAISTLNMKNLLYTVLKKMSGHHFFYKSDPCDLDPWPKEHKLNRGQAHTN